MFHRKNFSSSASSIFISYRRKDTSGHCGRLYDRLIDHYGENRIFMDINDIKPGLNFVDEIKTAFNSCNMLIVLIGQEWLVKTDNNKSRLDDTSDFVHIEIATALEKKIITIPVLVQSAPMPQAQDLPEQLKPLASFNAIELSDSRWNEDVDRLIGAIEELTAKPHKSKKVLKLFLILFSALVVFSTTFYLIQKPIQTLFV